MKSFRTLNTFLTIAAISLLAVMQPVKADTASWTNWQTNNGNNGTETGTLEQNGNTITVSYTGNHFDVDHGSYFYSNPSSFLTSLNTNTPGTNGTIRMTGGTSTINTLHFSSAVLNPLFSVFSVGQGGVPVSFNFDAPFTLLNSGGGNWGGGSLTVSGNSLTGYEGNGVIQFNGSFTDISFTTPDYEDYYGFTVGAVTQSLPPTVSSVPVPPAAFLFASALGVLGIVRRSAAVK